MVEKAKEAFIFVAVGPQKLAFILSCRVECISSFAGA